MFDGILLGSDISHLFQTRNQNKQNVTDNLLIRFKLLRVVENLDVNKLN